MKTLLPACLLACALFGAVPAAIIWQENFDSYADGTTNGTSGKWSVDVSTCTLDGDDHFEVRSQHMEGNDLDGEAVWRSESIPITGLTNVSVFIDVNEEVGGLESSDYIRLYYKLNGGSETLFETAGDNSGNFGSLTAAQTNLTGNTLEIVVRMINNATTEFILFDNIRVTDASNTAPKLSPIGNQTVFLSDTLTVAVIASDVDGDLITLSASNLPPGAVFNTAASAGTVTALMIWSNSSPDGIYTSVFYAADGSTNGSETIVITAENRAHIDGRFYGWDSDTIVKLDNEQFWRNAVGTGNKENPPLYNPAVTVTNWLQTGIWRISVEDGEQNRQVVRMEIVEVQLTNTFSGLRYQNVYQLADGTTWKQISFENISSNASPITAWRWMENGQQQMRFLDRNDKVIGSCTVEASAPPADTTIHSEIDGWFRGWQSKRVFALKNGEFWQQTSLESSTETLYSPEVIITNYLQAGFWRMSLAGEPGYISVQQLTNVTRTAVDRWFYGFGRNNIFPLADGSWWKQTSSENSASTRFHPEILIWSENGTDYLEMPDEGFRVAAEPLDVQLESTVTNAFTGLHYGNLYRLDGAGDWIQLSFEHVSTNMTGPSVMLWKDGGQTNMIARDSRDVTIGTCTVADPALDSDSDGFSNADEALAGSDPLNEQSRFELRQTDRYILSWEAVEGRIYTIEWTPSLTENFQPLENSMMWPQNSWTDTVHEVSTEGFYRISVRLAE